MIAPHELTASEATAAMHEGRLTSVGLVRACLDRIAEREPEIQAWKALILNARSLRRAQPTRLHRCGLSAEFRSGSKT
jgi:Asp-tRNA(Asn)/Glu-tRNA(Gln) amidotransferase A subunit family amidase